MTRTKTSLLVLSALAVTSLAACSPRPAKLEDAQYWQRKNATSALYLRGPKAQQTLHMDLATCVNEISELDRIGALREAIPADVKNGQVPDPSTAQGKLSRWDTPKRDGALYAEHLPYSDFETCMDAKGWERVESLPYVQADTARADYLKTVYGMHWQSNQNVNKRAEAPATSYSDDPDRSVND